MKRPLSVGLALGLVVGAALPIVAFGVGTTHVVCSPGPVIGWSGPLATPFEVALAPPGGFVNLSYNMPGEFGWSDLPMNDSTADYGVYNWTVSSQNRTEALGWGSNAPCSQITLGVSATLGNPPPPWGGCGGCQVAPPAPSGIGQRLSVPQQLFYSTLPTALMNATYGVTPNATITWNESNGGVTWSNPAGLSGLPVTIGPFYEFGRLYGLNVTLKQSEIRFGIPIHLITGGTETVPASFPLDFPYHYSEPNYLSITMTYVFPAATAQGTWEIYLAGAGSPYSVGGLLFEQTAGPT